VYHEADIRKITTGVSIPPVSIAQNLDENVNNDKARTCCGWELPSRRRVRTVKKRAPNDAAKPNIRAPVTTSLPGIDSQPANRSVNSGVVVP
jgi:hypothetical protein